MGNGVSLLEQRMYEEILEEAKEEQIAMVMRRKEKAGVVWPRQKKRRNREHQSSCRNEDGRKRPRGRPTLRWKDTVRRDLKAWIIREEWATDKTRYHAQGDGGER